MKFGLKESDIELIQTVLSNYKEVDKVLIYGSRAKGTFKPASDIDLTLLGEKLNLTIQYKIENDLDDLMLPYLFDISIFNQISNTDLVEHINRVGIVFFERIK
jgi:type I restriction enzyme S subunit